jgi:hypothetical protein
LKEGVRGVNEVREKIIKYGLECLKYDLLDKLDDLIFKGYDKVIINSDEVKSIIQQFFKNIQEVCKIEGINEEARISSYFVYADKAKDYFIVVNYRYWYGVIHGGGFDVEILNKKEYKKFVSEILNKLKEKKRKIKEDCLLHK